MVESDLTRDHRRGNKSGERSVNLLSIGRCSLETKLCNRIMSLDADTATKLKKYEFKFSTSEAYTQKYDWLFYCAVMYRIPQRGWEVGTQSYF